MMNLGDNYVTGDNIYLRELQSFFFEVLGMMSITHYGAIGDGRRDNYGPIQVAIDDAHRRGLSFIYVPYGRFIYTGELINTDGITFIGNPHAHIVNVRTREEIEIKQFGFWKVDAGDEYYTKEECDTRFLTESEVTDLTYTKSEVDTMLANYYTKSEVDALLADKQHTLVAGDNISIQNNIISAYGGGGGGGDETAFFACPFPTVWVGSSTSATAANSYGTWTISTIGQVYDSSISNVFDRSLSTSANIVTTSLDDKPYVEIDCPTGVSIKPAQVKFAYSGLAYDPNNDPVVFQGYDGANWVTLTTINVRSTSSSSFSIDRTLTTNSFFTKFRLNNIHKNGGYGSGNIVSEIQIVSGIIKQE